MNLAYIGYTACNMSSRNKHLCKMDPCMKWGRISGPLGFIYKEVLLLLQNIRLVLNH